MQSRQAEEHQDKLAIILQGDRDAGVRSDQAQTQQAQEHLNNVDQAIESVAASVAELRQRYERLDVYVKTLAKVVQQKQFRLSDIPVKDLEHLTDKIMAAVSRYLPKLLATSVRELVPEYLPEVLATSVRTAVAPAVKALESKVLLLEQGRA